MAIEVKPCSGDDGDDRAAERAGDLATELADIAATTFPLACPPTAAPADIAAHIAEHLSARRFAEFLTDPHRRLIAARDGDQIVGYAMLVDNGESRIELSKMYVLESQHGSGAAAALMRAAISWAEDRGASSIWLGVNQGNERAQRFYRKHGFQVAGTRTFTLGESLEDDYVMVRPI